MIPFFLGSKLGQAILLGLVAVVAYGFWTAHQRQIGAERALAAMRAATEQETERREAVIEKTQAEARAYVARIRKQEKANATLLQRLHAASARLDDRPCWDADSVRRLREIGQPAGKGTPARRPAERTD